MKKTNKFFLLLYIFAFTSLTAAAASPLLEKLPLMSRIEWDAKNATQSEIYGVELNSQIYEKCQSGFGDIRIIDNGNEIPYMMEKEITHITGTLKKTCHSKLLSLKKLEDNKYEICVELTDKKLFPQEASLMTPSRDYEKNVSAFGSNNLQDWEKLSENTTVFDYSQIVDLRNNVIPLSAKKFKYYKFTIDNFTETKKSAIRELISESRKDKDYSKIEKSVQRDDTFRINDISLVAIVKTNVIDENRTIEYPLKSFSKEKEKDTNNDLIIIETLRQPLTKIKIETGSVNFFRKTDLEASDNRTDWYSVCSSSIKKIDMKGFNKEELEISFPENRSPYYRIRIRNGDSPALEINGAKAHGNVYLAKFIMPSKAEKPAVYYGGKDIQSPSYDIAVVLNKFKDSSHKMLKLENPVPNPSYKTVPGKTEKLYWKYIFIAAIAVMVCGLGWALMRGVKKIENMPE